MRKLLVSGCSLSSGCGFTDTNIEKQNKLILDFGQKHVLQWTQHHTHSDIFITTYKP